MAGSPGPAGGRGWTLVAALAGLLALTRLAGCGGEGSGPDDGFDRPALLTGVAAEVLIPGYQAAAIEAEELSAATAGWSAVLQGGGAGAAERQAAREAWSETMLAWQLLEPMQVGPAGSPSQVVGGASLRDEIYSWPTVNPCRVDQELVDGAWDAPDFFSTSLVNVYGLDALEYLLFEEGPDNACASQVAINETGEWAALGLEEVERRRAAFATVLAGQLVADVQTLLSAWDSPPADFLEAFAGAGNEASPYADPEEAVNDLFGALFYLEITVKDRKLARPLGLSDCSDPTCPEALESLYAEHSLANIRANLEGGRLLFLGGEPGVGFDDMLAHFEATELSDELVAAFDLALAAVDAVPQSAAAQLAEDPAPLHAVHAAVKEVTDLLKGEVATVLFLRVPQEAAGDND